MMPKLYVCLENVSRFAMCCTAARLLYSAMGAAVVLLGMSAPLAGAVADNIRIPARLERAPESSCILAGPIHDQIRGVIENWLLPAPDQNPAMLDMFADRDRQPYRNLLPWSGEFAGKYLTACAQIICLTRDAVLQARAQKVVDRLITLQDEDGYLGPFPKAHRLSGHSPNTGSDPTWDAWGHYHLMLGLMLWHKQTGDAKALRCAERIGDLLCKRFLGGGKHVADIGSPDQNQAVIHGLCRLHEETGTKRYLELAEQIVTEFELPGAGDYLRTALAGKEFYATPKPRWESLHSIMGLAELYRIGGRDDYRRAFEHIWWSIVKLDRHNNGGFSSGEQAVGNPYNGAPIETCCTIAWLAMSVEMLRLTGSSIVADEIELSTLNSIIGLHSADGKWCTYNTPMDGRRVPSTQDISFQIRPGSEQLNCCSVNAARGFGFISEWALMTEHTSAEEPDALVVNWYGPSALSSRINDVKVTLTQVTGYPRTGRIDIEVSPDRSLQFPLKLRIPYWSTETRVSVNGEEMPAQPGQYCVIDRLWRSGDRVSIDLDMRTRVWAGERECAGKVSLYHGPLLLAREESSDSTHHRPGKWQSFGNLFACREKGTAFEFDFEGEGIRWFGCYFDDAGKARVLIDQKEVAVVDQYGPVREVLFTWEHTGLTAGRHTIRIEVSGEKAPESRDTWSNVAGFGPPGSDIPEPWDRSPAIDVKTLNSRPIEAGGDTDALVTLEVNDAAGHTVRLRDFGTAGRGGRTYASWLRAENISPVPFSHSNPLRSAVPAR